MFILKKTAGFKPAVFQDSEESAYIPLSGVSGVVPSVSGASPFGAGVSPSAPVSGCSGVRGVTASSVPLGVRLSIGIKVLAPINSDLYNIAYYSKLIVRYQSFLTILSTIKIKLDLILFVKNFIHPIANQNMANK
ncbi:MAG: hypothetical protein WDZ85_00480 [Candidatus Paceibacterota bacterium]